ncbi:hypothetical protein, partial [Escherichia coli]
MKLNAITANRARLAIQGNLECNDAKSSSANANAVTIPRATVNGQQSCGSAQIGGRVDCNDETVRGQYAT